MQFMQLHAVGGLLDLSVGVYTGYQARRFTQGLVKMTNINFAILISHVIVTYLRLIKNTYLKKMKRDVLFIRYGFF